MDFDLSEDQLALRQGARALLEGKASALRVREIAAAGEHYDRALWEAMSEQGWQAVQTPADVGGLGLGSVELAVLCEELGRVVGPAPLLTTVVVAEACRRSEAGDASLSGAPIERWCERLESGDAVGAVAWSSGDNAVHAGPRQEGWSLSGRTDPFPYAPAADLVLTCAQDDHGLALYAVAPARPGAFPAMDRTRCIAALTLDGEPALRIGDGSAVEIVIDKVNVASCAEMLGAADRVLAMTVQYAKDRVQFGRPIGSFQAVKHRCADMLVDVEGMRSATYYAAWAVGAGDDESHTAASAAKVWCADAARRVMASALQVHGGIGFTWEHDLHLFVKRSQLDQVSYGSARFHRERLAELLRPRAEQGLPIL
ncbi:MAG: acyl-CoA dehydrogenase family protein [Acidimicrobiales bacterium]